MTVEVGSSLFWSPPCVRNSNPKGEQILPTCTPRGHRQGAFATHHVATGKERSPNATWLHAKSGRHTPRGHRQGVIAARHLATGKQRSPRARGYRQGGLATRHLATGKERSPHATWLQARIGGLNLNVLDVKFNSQPTFEDHVRGIVSRVSHRIGIFRLGRRIFVDTSVLLSSHFAFVLPVFEYCSPVCGQLLNVTFSFLSARCIRWPGFVLMRISWRIIDVLLLG